MSDLAEKKATYADLYGVPEDMIGEIIDGELIVHPRPSRRHTRATSALGYKLGPPYDFGEGGGPGGWIIIVEPEIGLGEHTIVPDLAGWKKEKFPVEEDHNWISVAPDWVCEVLSPKTFRTDKVKKMPVYAHHGVGHIWLIDPVAMSMDVFRLGVGVGWLLLGSFTENDKVRAEPFQEIEINLEDLWLESLQPSTS
ncbi:MAG: Uma2 family endonuclease [Syntrophobacteraceae bacterium]|nr:Uma2 family endonuclease [Syntrophobacteraceae bacterium]